MPPIKKANIRGGGKTHGLIIVKDSLDGGRGPCTWPRINLSKIKPQKDGQHWVPPEPLGTNRWAKVYNPVRKGAKSMPWAAGFVTPRGLSAAQSGQSAKPFLQSSELGLPQPLTHRRVCPPPLWYRGEGHTRWRGWESPNFDQGTYTVVLCMNLYFVLCRIWLKLYGRLIHLYKILWKIVHVVFKYLPRSLL